MKMEMWYEGGLSTRVVHPTTGAQLITDAPRDNQGLGRFFSPTDLLAAALGSCLLTLMGIAARRLGVDIQGTRLSMEKTMQTSPVRRIGALRAEIYCPQVFTPEIQTQLRQAAEGCPVHYSLHPDIVCTFIFHWGSP